MRPSVSVRRTSSIDVSWPDGPDGDRRFHGRARDYLTPAAGSPGRAMDAAWFEATIDSDKQITAIRAEPEPALLPELVGERGGAHLRLVMQQIMPELIAGSAPLYLLLDDISGVSLVCGWAWAQWDPDWAVKVRERMPRDQLDKMLSAREGVCWGLQPGNSGLDWNGPQNSSVGTADARDLRNPADPEGWHDFPEIDGPSFRRARRIDVMHDEEAGMIRIDAAFQDSAPTPAGGRAAIHEYRIAATADAGTLEILTLEPEARILPFSECPGAIGNARRLVGARIPDIREEVLAQLRGPQGCTHLNDALRALADVPRLASYLAMVPG